MLDVSLKKKNNNNVSKYIYSIKISQTKKIRKNDLSNYEHKKNFKYSKANNFILTRNT